MRKSLFTLMTVIMVVLLALPTLVPNQTVSAQEDGDPIEVELEGVVQYVGEGFIVVDGIVVYANDIFDVTSVNVTDTVAITGELQEDGTVLATAYALVEAGEGPTDPEPGDSVVVVGYVESLDPDIIIEGYVVAPASAFNPSTLEEGDLVILEGLLLNDGETIQATSLALLVETDAEDEDECLDDGEDEDGEDSGDVVTDGDGEGDEDDPCADEEDEEDDEENTGVCENVDHPVTLRYAEAYGISAEQITEWRCDGFGFGQIGKVLALAEVVGVDPQEIFDRIAGGEGWGNILKDYDVKPGDLAPGKGLNKDKERGNSGNAGNNGNGNKPDKSNNGKGPKDK